MSAPNRHRLRGALILAVGALACDDKAAPQLRPYGEVVLSIDTDAPVPGFVGRLRIDVFDEGGRWLESRDVARPGPSDWPVSFSLYTTDEVRTHRTLIRARAYLEGRVRDYRGERFEDRQPYVEPWAANTLPELCENLPELLLGKELTVRRGSRTLTGNLLDRDQCSTAIVGGVAAARLNVGVAGDYRIETTSVIPETSDPNLFIRKDCRDALTQLACNDDISRDDLTFNDRSRLILHLDPGSYTIMSGAYLANPSDVTLRAELCPTLATCADADWAAPPSSAVPPPQKLGSMPRLVTNGVDVTPKQEPEPHVTIDRLALVTLVPGRKERATIVLRLACGGQMAKLSAAASDAPPVLGEAATCVDAEEARVAVTALDQTRFTASAPITEVGTAVRAQPCAAAASPLGPICIPAGTFVFGSPIYAPYPVNTTPERFAVMSRFWLDPTEVTVGRWRAALARGFKSPDFSPLENNGPLDTVWPPPDDSAGTLYRHCTFSQTAASAGQVREDYPLTCLTLNAARAFCQFQHGDLPTEAQWQYTATKAGRAVEIDDLCDGFASADDCLSQRKNPVAVTDPARVGDTTPLGVRGLAGNVAEMVLDSFQALDSPCWNGASLVDPVCWEKNPTLRTIVGFDWANPASVWRRDLAQGESGLFTDFFHVNAGIPSIGFRCAYGQEPR